MYWRKAKYSRPIKILFVVLCISVLIILMLGFSSASSPVYSRAASPFDPFRAVETGGPIKSNILNINAESEFLNEAEHIRKFMILPANASLSNIIVMSFSLFLAIYFSVVYFSPTSTNVKLNI